MANTVIALKKSDTPGNIPPSLVEGEIAINYADGKLYYKNTAGYVTELKTADLGNYFGSVNANGTFVVADTTSDIFTLVAGDNVSIVGDAINDTITISASLVGGGDPKYAFEKANSANYYAYLVDANTKAAFDAANNVTPQITPAFTTANTAYDKANAANILAYQVSQALNDANTIAIAAFDYANTISSDADEKANAAIITSNAAYDSANAAHLTANTAYNKANAANILAYQVGGSLDKINTTVQIANSAYDKANAANYYAYLVDANTKAAFDSANNVSPQITPAFTTANTAYDKANSANLLAYQIGGAVTGLNTTVQIANTAYDKANAANYYAYLVDVNAKAAFAYANTISSDADEKANAAIITANAAYDDANAAQLTANTAYDKANAANLLAYQIGGALGRINTTVQTANTAYDKANSANYYAYLIDANTKAAFAKANTSGGVNVGSTQPTNNTNGDLWWNTDLGRLLIYYDDSSSVQWVDATPAGEVGAQGNSGNIRAGTVTLGSPISSPTVTNSGNGNYAILNFELPRPANVSIPATASIGSPSSNPTATGTTLANGDLSIAFSLPRAPNVSTPATTTSLSPASSPTAVSTLLANNDLSVAFSLPRAPNVSTPATATSLAPSAAPTTTPTTLANGDLSIAFSLPRSANVLVGEITSTLAPSSIPTITGTTRANGDVSLAFNFAMQANVIANNTISIQPSQAPNANSFFFSNNDFGINFFLPRAPNVSIPATTSVGSPSSSPTAVGTRLANGDTSIAFTLPRAPNVSTPATTTALSPISSPTAVSTLLANNDLSVAFSLPRAPNVLFAAVTTGAPGTASSLSPFTEANGDITLTLTIPRGNVGNYNPKSISISGPQVNDNFTIFYTDKVLTVQNVVSITLSQNPIWANSQVNANIVFGTDRTTTGTFILQNLVTGFSKTANANISYSTATIPANNFVWVQVGGIVNAPAEFHVTMQFVN